MPLRSRQITDLLSYLGDLGIHRLLVGDYSIKLGGQLVDRLSKTFIGLSLSHYEALCKTLQVRFELRRWRRWVVRSSILEPMWLHRTLGWRVGVLIERTGMDLLTLNVGSGVKNILGAIKVMEDVSMHNVRRTIVALNRCVPLQTTSFTSSINSNWTRSTYLVQSLYLAG